MTITMPTRPADRTIATATQGSSLADVLERVLDKGIVIAGDIAVSVGATELLSIRIRLLVASVDKAKEMGINWWENDPYLNHQNHQLLEANQQLLAANQQLQTRLDSLETELCSLKGNLSPSLTMSPIANLEIAPASGLETLDTSPSPKNGLASLLLTVVELIRQLMEAQVIRRMDAGYLSEADLDRAAESFQKLEEQVIHLCNIFEIDPADLNIDLGEVGSLFPKQGGYYPGEISTSPSILELLDRLLNTGVVLQGNVDLGVAQLNLIHAKLQLVLTSRPIE